MAPSSSSPAVEQLTAELAADPGNVELRRVLADALQAAGDERGEYIALAMSDDAGVRARAEELLARNLERWVEPLVGVQPETCRFDRGFLVEAHVSGPSEDIVADRWEWSTLERVVFEHYVEVVPLVERMPLLQLLCMPAFKALGRLERSHAGQQLRVLGCADYTPPRGRFPALRVLARSVPSHPRGEHARARDLGLHALVFVGAAVDELPAIFEAREEGVAETRVVVGEVPWWQAFAGAGWRMRVYRDEPRALVEYVPGAGVDPDAFPAIFDALRYAGITELDVRIEPRIRAWFDARVRGATVRFDGPGVDLSAVDRT